MKTPSPESERMLETLRQAVNKALDRKRRLGQYAIIWKNGKPVVLEADKHATGRTQMENN